MTAVDMFVRDYTFIQPLLAGDRLASKNLRECRHVHNEPIDRVRTTDSKTARAAAVPSLYVHSRAHLSCPPPPQPSDNPRRIFCKRRPAVFRYFDPFPFVRVV